MARERRQRRADLMCHGGRELTDGRKSLCTGGGMLGGREHFVRMRQGLVFCAQFFAGMTKIGFSLLAVADIAKHNGQARRGFVRAEYRKRLNVKPLGMDVLLATLNFIGERLTGLLELPKPLGS